ncbi:MAG: hypothetical protein ABS79_07175 [Planctomycetes bacterium SCN 63-9]|nr:MAG: hypothetical protein ABS79_07175 [Planctomycetes bacterium SCN 63-9]
MPGRAGRSGASVTTCAEADPAIQAIRKTIAIRRPSRSEARAPSRIKHKNTSPLSEGGNRGEFFR